MNYKIASIAVIMVFALGISAQAKDKPAPPPKPLTSDDIVAKMKLQLELTDAQVEKVKPIIEDYMAKEAQAKLEEKKQLARVLTGEQMFTWNFLQKEQPHEKKHSKP
jgi:Spy/CpxP family protein refolding chaperone